MKSATAWTKPFGVNSWDIGSRLPKLFAESGFEAPQVRIQQHAFQRGGEKRPWELTLQEARPAIVEHGVAASEELDRICAELRRIAEDESVLVIAARVTQVCARK